MQHADSHLDTLIVLRFNWLCHWPLLCPKLAFTRTHESQETNGEQRERASKRKRKRTHGHRARSKQVHTYENTENEREANLLKLTSCTIVNWIPVNWTLLCGERLTFVEVWHTHLPVRWWVHDNSLNSQSWSLHELPMMKLCLVSLFFFSFFFSLPWLPLFSSLSLGCFARSPLHSLSLCLSILSATRYPIFHFAREASIEREKRREREEWNASLVSTPCHCNLLTGP